MVTSWLPVLVTVTWRGVPVAPQLTSPKSSDDGEIPICPAVPVPVITKASGSGAQSTEAPADSVALPVWSVAESPGEKVAVIGAAPAAPTATLLDGVSVNFALLDPSATVAGALPAL